MDAMHTEALRTFGGRRRAGIVADHLSIWLDGMHVPFSTRNLIRGVYIYIYIYMIRFTHQPSLARGELSRKPVVPMQLIAWRKNAWETLVKRPANGDSGMIQQPVPDGNLHLQYKSFICDPLRS